jgi:endonuclease YncB( thermonuclease family)
MDSRNLEAPVELPGMKLGRNHRNKQRRYIVKRTIIGIACALVAPLAFAQTSTTTTETTTEPATTTQTTSTTYTAGTVTTYEPGKTVVVRGEQGPVSFALGTAARVVDGAGKIVTAPLRAGQKVRVYYTGPTEKRVVERVIVED